MKLTGKPNTQVENEGNRENRREAIRQTGMLLTDEQLNMVSGGSGKWGITEPYYNGGDTN